MSGTKISGIATAASAFTGTEKFEIVQGGATKYGTPAQMATYIGAGGYPQKAQSKLATVYSVSNNSATDIPFDTESHDTDNMVDIAGNPTRITIQTDGEYDVTFWGYYASNATGKRWAAIYQGGSVLIAVDSGNAVNGTIHGLNLSVRLDLVAGNYLTIKTFQDSGGGLNVAGVFNVKRVG
jgi:hypothetical protein